MRTEIEKVDLHYTDGGSSDKVYHAKLIDEGDSSYTCETSWGRRGGTLAHGSKAVRKGYAAAHAAFVSVEREKTAKGYVVTDRWKAGTGAGRPVSGNPATPAAAPAAAKPATVAPARPGPVAQLCWPIDRDDAADLIADDSWAMEEKHDGERRHAGCDAAGVAVGYNRRCLEVRLGEPLANALVKIHQANGGCEFVLDGEHIGDDLVVWDILSLKGKDLCAKPFSERVKILGGLDFTGQTRVRRARHVVGRAAKRAVYDAVDKKNGEGVVFKRLGEARKPGQATSTSGWRKCKFKKSLSAIVSKANDKRSVALQVLAADGSPIGIGNVTIPPNHELPAIGQVVEVEYLNARVNGSLYQPVYKGRRGDIPPEDCLETQRVYIADQNGDEGEDAEQAA